MKQPQTSGKASLAPVRVDDHFRWTKGLTRWQAADAARLARISAEIEAALSEWRQAIKEEGR